MRVERAKAHISPMSEYVLILYPIVLLGYLMLAARWQPKGAPHHDQPDEPAHRRRRH
jgi:hypothetical protein